VLRVENQHLEFRSGIQMSQAFEPRPFCLTCLKSKRACLCQHVKPFECSVKFVILMHPKEFRDRAGTGTGRILHQSIQNSELIVGARFEKNEKICAFLADPNFFPCVLYPGSQALNLSSQEVLASFGSQISGLTPLIFLLDASWSCAKKMMQLNPVLAKLPRVSFESKRSSAYLFKKQPKEHCLSTLEAVHEILCLLSARGLAKINPENGHDDLVTLFQMLVNFQSGFSPID
jgi:DTW domain-containing protein